MLPYLGIEMSTRGQDAWGASDGKEVIKHLGSIVDSFECPEHWTQGIFHTRAASHGSPKVLENAHPFVFAKPNGSEVIGIHNGIIRTHTQLNAKYGRNFQVDSMHVFANFAEGRGVEGIEGWGALAWYEDGSLNFSRFCSTDLTIATLEEGELVFCSLYFPLDKITRILGNPIKTKWVVDEFTKYTVGSEGSKDILYRIGEMEYPDAKKKTQIPTTYPYNPTQNGGSGYSSQARTGGNQTSYTGYWMELEVCYICRTAKIDKTQALVCKPCLAEAWKEFIVEELTLVETERNPVQPDGERLQAGVDFAQRNSEPDQCSVGEAAREIGCPGSPHEGTA